jgi:Tfp pilus assembly PilM family ATPase
MALGIEFKHGSINIVEAKFKKNSITCKKTHSFEFNEDWIDAQGIRSEEIENLALLLDQHIDDQEFSDKKEAFLCINNSSIIYRELITPKIDDKKLPLVVRSEMMDALNLTPDYIMDFVILEEVNDEEGNECYRMLAVAILNSALETYIDLMKKAKIKPIAIDSATNSIIKVVSMIPEIESLEQVIISEVGDAHLRLYLFESGNYILSRNIKLTTFTDLTKEGYIETIEDNLNKMIQFSYTRGSLLNAISCSNLVLSMDHVSSKRDLLIFLEHF